MRDQGLTSEELDRVLKFEGYGTKSAPYWFLGMEEGGGSIEELKTRARLFNPVEDLHSADNKLGFDITKYFPTWRVMSMLVLAMQGTSGWRDTTEAQEYQATKLGRDDGDTFLTELMPLPCRNIKDWPYEMLFPTKADYIARIRPGRIQWLRSEISTFQPRLVICYGKGNWRYYEDIFSDVEFKTELDAKIRVGVRGPSLILLLNFLSPDLVKTDLIAQIADMFGQEHGAG